MLLNSSNSGCAELSERVRKAVSHTQSCFPTTCYLFAVLPGREKLHLKKQDALVSCVPEVHAALKRETGAVTPCN